MQRPNTTLDDIASVIGFSSTIDIAICFGDSNLYIPQTAKEGQALVGLIGMSSAQRLSDEWGSQHLAIPSLSRYDERMKRWQISRMYERGFGKGEISTMLKISRRRVQQICQELKAGGVVQAGEIRKGPQKKDLTQMPSAQVDLFEVPALQEAQASVAPAAWPNVTRHKLRG